MLAAFPVSYALSSQYLCLKEHTDPHRAESGEPSPLLALVFISSLPKQGGCEVRLLTSPRKVVLCEKTWRLDEMTSLCGFIVPSAEVFPPCSTQPPTSSHLWQGLEHPSSRGSRIRASPAPSVSAGERRAQNSPPNPGGRSRACCCPGQEMSLPRAD